MVTHYIKGNSKFHPRIEHEGPKGEYRYTSTLSLTSELEEGALLKPGSGALTLSMRAVTHCTES